MKTKKDTKIMLIGGHMTPALAVLEELQQRGYRNFVWVGNKYSQTQAINLSAEYNLINSKGIYFANFKSGKLWRKWTPATFFKGIYNLILIPVGLISGFLLVAKQRPDLIISFGGYLALPIVIAGRIFRTKIVAHEQTLAPGLANKLASKFVDKIFVSWEKALKKFPKNKTVFTGNPLRQDVLKTVTNEFNFPDKLPLIYVTGGNQGANTINRRLYQILPELLKKVNIIHQVGNSSLTHDLENAKTIWNALPAELQVRYRFFDNILGPEIAEIFAKADLLVSRSGANTITEILAFGKRCILIPIPWSSNNEQLMNAKLVSETGLGWVLQQYDAMPAEELGEAIEKALELVGTNNTFLNEVTYTQAKTAATELVKLDAAKVIVDQCELLLA